jgi:hypothetical protein
VDAAAARQTTMIRVTFLALLAFGHFRKLPVLP